MATDIGVPPLLWWVRPLGASVILCLLRLVPVCLFSITSLAVGQDRVQQHRLGFIPRTPIPVIH
eukprot:13429636-Heterocapsa_arctica.AAC.1